MNYSLIIKILIFVLIFLFLTRAFAQIIPNKEGCIEIKKVSHNFLENKNGDQTKRITNKANRPYLLLYLDTLGNLTEKVGYGKHHNTDLRLLDFVEQNEFENSRLINTIEYNTDYHKNINADYKTRYLYNNKNQLIQEKEFYFKTDSLFMQIDYEYDSIGNKTKTIFNQNYYYLRTFDGQSKIQSLQQIYDSKLRWEWTYTFSDTTRIGNFTSHYNDGHDYTEQEIRTYRNNKLIRIEEKYTSYEGLSTKTELHYDKLGLIFKIDYYEAYTNEMKYQLRNYKIINIKFCRQLTLEIIDRINDIIYDE